MAIFGRKRIKKVKKREFIPPVAVKEIPDMLKTEAPAALPALPRALLPERKMERVEEPSQPAFAPVFVKLTRYRQILSAMNQLKMNVNLIKTQLAVLCELDKLREENLKLLRSALKRVDERLNKLDSEFMRPSGFVEETPNPYVEDMEVLGETIDELKGQIEYLKSEVETIA